MEVSCWKYEPGVWATDTCLFQVRGVVRRCKPRKGEKDEERVCRSSEGSAGLGWSRVCPGVQNLKGSEPKGDRGLLGHRSPRSSPSSHTLVVSSPLAQDVPVFSSGTGCFLAPGIFLILAHTPAFPVQWELGKGLGPALFPSSDASSMRHPMIQFFWSQIELLAVLQPSRQDWRSAYVNE